MMKKVVDKMAENPFSDKQMIETVNGRANLVLYPQIGRYSSIDQLLGEHGVCIILYITNESPTSIYGHWTCIIRHDGYIEYFDPYAYMFDDPMILDKYGSPEYLSELFRRCDYDIVFNTHQLQNRKSPNVATCGRHVAMRINLKFIPLPQYAKLMTSKFTPNPDEYVTMFTVFIDK